MHSALLSHLRIQSIGEARIYCQKISSMFALSSPYEGNTWHNVLAKESLTVRLFPFPPSPPAFIYNVHLNNFQMVLKLQNTPFKENSNLTQSFTLIMTYNFWSRTHIFLTLVSDATLRQKVMIEGLVVQMLPSKRPYAAILMVITPLSECDTDNSLLCVIHIMYRVCFVVVKKCKTPLEL